MRLSVGEVMRLTGISARTLHYYDEIGLLKPSETSEAGYRFYDGEALEKLQQILFYRELDFSLSDIGRILSSPDHDRGQALREHRALLVMKRDRLDGLIRLTDDTLKGETENMGLQKFNDSGIRAARDAYAAEAEARWGKTEAYQESARRANGRTPAEEAHITEEADEIIRGFSTMLDRAADDATVQAQVERWRQHISQYYYDCTPVILGCLGEMYSADERFTANLDRFADGTAQLMTEAIRAYCKTAQ